MFFYLIHNAFFKLITFRAALAGIGAFLGCLALGPRVIRWLKSKKVGERIEKNDSKKLDQLMAGKKDTPTMGGIFVIAAIVLSISLFGNFANPVLYLFLGVVMALGAVGAADDYMKLRRISTKGMRERTKLLCQMLVGYAAGVVLYLVMLRTDPDRATKFYILFDGYIDVGVWYPALVMIVIVSTSNAVNITDGLDGLAGGCMAVSSFAYAVIAYVAGRHDFAEYLQIPHIRAAQEATVFATAMLGATLGFLWFNNYPAQVFMGDSGSLPLGGALGLLACVTKMEMLLFLVGGVFVVEALSSLLQILSFKLIHRRIFKIAPLHHHFQFEGVPEAKITVRFWIVAIVMAVASLALLKLR